MAVFAAGPRGRAAAPARAEDAARNLGRTAMPLWMLPLVYTAASIVAAFAVPRLERAWLPAFQIGVSDSSAVAVLSAAASGVMGLTAIVFSVAFVLVQFSAIAYSPRISLRFSRDPADLHALGVFFATFTYALTTIAWTDRGGTQTVPADLLVPRRSCWSSRAWSFFALLVRRLNDLQITAMLRDIGDSGRDGDPRASVAAAAGRRRRRGAAARRR